MPAGRLSRAATCRESSSRDWVSRTQIGASHLVAPLELRLVVPNACTIERPEFVLVGIVRPLRYLPSGHLVEVTGRTIHGRLLLTPDRPTCDLMECSAER